MLNKKRLAIFWTISRMSFLGCLLMVHACIYCQDLNSNKQKSSSINRLKILTINKEKQKSDSLLLKQYRIVSDGKGSDVFRKTYTALHGDSQTVIFADAKKMEELLYDSLNNLYYSRMSNQKVLIPQATVFGWHPYWIKEACIYYPYSLLTTIAFFAYDVNEEDGSCYDQDAIESWNSSPLIDSAKKHNIDLLLTLTSYGKGRNDIFLSNSHAIATLGDSVLKLLKAKGAQGIDIDFTGISKANNQNFVNFVNTLHSKIGDTCIVSLHVTSEDLKNGGINLKALKEIAKVSIFVIQGYDYENSLSGVGALAPLYSKAPGGNSISNTLNICLLNGLQPNDIVLNLPLYGTVSYKKNSGAGKYLYETTEMSYIDIVSLYEKNYSNTIFPWSRSASVVFGKKEDTVIWYESAESIMIKFKFAKANKLRGVGLWGLGYDGGQPEVWDAVVENYGTNVVNEINPIYIDNGKLFSIIYSLQRYRKYIGVGTFILVSFFILGLLLSFLDWRVREIFFRNYSNRMLLSAFILLFFIFAVYCFTAEETKPNAFLLPFIIGIVSGGTVVFLITKFYLSYRKKMP